MVRPRRERETAPCASAPDRRVKWKSDRESPEGLYAALHILINKKLKIEYLTKKREREINSQKIHIICLTNQNRREP